MNLNNDFLLNNYNYYKKKENINSNINFDKSNFILNDNINSTNSSSLHPHNKTSLKKKFGLIKK